LLPHLLAAGVALRESRWPRVLASIACALTALALAGPAWERLPQPLYQNRAARVYALELASSMLAQDVTPSRYERARFKLNDLLAHGGDGQTALIAYAGDAFVVAPLTDDANTVSNLVDALDPSTMPVAGNNAARAIDAGVDLIRQAGMSTGEIVLLADGVGTSDALAAAQRARAAGMRVSVLGIGTPQGAPVPLAAGGFLKNAGGDIVLPKLDAGALAALADAGGGRYLTFSADGSDIAALGTRQVATDDAVKSEEATSARFRDRGPWLLLLLLPLAAFAFRRGWLMAALLAFWLAPHPAYAWSWTDLWRTPDQQAQQALDTGDATTARQLAKSPGLRGSASYRAGEFDAAEQDFAQASGADADYNRGNALAKQGRYQDAIDAYDHALRESPGMDDAAANKRAVEEFLKQQQQQQQQKDQNKSKDHQGKQQNQDGSGSSDQQDSQDQQQQDQDQNGQSQQGQDGEQKRKDAQSGANQQQQQGQNDKDSAQQQQAGKDNGQERGAEQQSSTARADEKKAQEQFRQRMDEAMKNAPQKDSKQQQAMRLGAAQNGATKNEQQQAIDQQLERVPDDPGGLLRQKFQIEYQRRQQRAQGGGG
jgi:Ca-activated chloride channel family protein